MKKNAIEHTILIQLGISSERYNAILRAEYNKFHEQLKKLEKEIQGIEAASESGGSLKKDLRSKRAECRKVKKIMDHILKDVKSYTETEAANGFAEWSTMQDEDPRILNLRLTWDNILNATSSYDAARLGRY